MHSRRARAAAYALVLAMTTSAPNAGAAPSAELRKLCDEYWQGTLRAHPAFATSLGDHRYDDRLEDPTPAGVEAERKRLRGLFERVRAIKANALDDADRMNHAALVQELQNQLVTLDLGFDEWVVDVANGPQTEFNNLPDITVLRNAEDGRHYLARIGKIPAYMDAHIANLTRGLAKGRAATQMSVKRVLGALDEMLARPAAEWPMASPARAAGEDWAAADRDSFRSALPTLVETQVAPAFRRYREFLASQVQPSARPPEKSGLQFVPGGKEAYRYCIQIQTSLDKDPHDIHETGLKEVERFRAELSELGRKVLGTGDVAEIQKRLRTDPSMHFSTADEVEKKALTTLRRAEAAVPHWFGIQPKLPCEVHVMGMHEAPNSTIAYYRPGAADGSRPGVYMINTYKPETRPRYEAEALAFHESVPGHHLQIAIQQELTSLPEFRRHQGVTSYVEGWALYTERLADEMGLYSSDLDRIGMLSFDAWRDCRLVVDTGIHSMGWSRQQAIDYMRENTVLAENNIENEVDRYINWPAQALAYKLGQLEILRLRREAREALGERFDIRAFHDEILRNGAIALPVLEAEVRRWIDQQKKGRP